MNRYHAGSPSRSLTYCAGCDVNASKNPLNWKYGGTNGVGDILYHINPSVDRGFTPGNCTIHLQEDESYSGVNTPGGARHWHYHLENLMLWDGAGTKRDTYPGVTAEVGDRNPFSWNTTLPDLLVMTPERTRNYIQFALGRQGWISSDTKDKKYPYCSTGGVNRPFSPQVSLPFPDTSMCCGDTSRLKESFAKVMVDCPFECFHDFQFFRSRTFAAEELVRVARAH